MASQGFDNTGLGTSEGGTSPGSHEREDTDGSVYQLLDGPSDVQRGVLQALGVSLPLSQSWFIQEGTNITWTASKISELFLTKSLKTSWGHRDLRNKNGESVSHRVECPSKLWRVYSKALNRFLVCSDHSRSVKFLSLFPPFPSPSLPSPSLWCCG